MQLEPQSGSTTRSSSSSGAVAGIQQHPPVAAGLIGVPTDRTRHSATPASREDVEGFNGFSAEQSGGPSPAADRKGGRLTPGVRIHSTTSELDHRAVVQDELELYGAPVDFQAKKRFTEAARGIHYYTHHPRDVVTTTTLSASTPPTNPTPHHHRPSAGTPTTGTATGAGTSSLRSHQRQKQDQVGGGTTDGIAIPAFRASPEVGGGDVEMVDSGALNRCPLSGQPPVHREGLPVVPGTETINPATDSPPALASSTSHHDSESLATKPKAAALPLPSHRVAPPSPNTTTMVSTSHKSSSRTSNASSHRPVLLDDLDADLMNLIRRYYRKKNKKQQEHRDRSGDDAILPPGRIESESLNPREDHHHHHHRHHGKATPPHSPISSQDSSSAILLPSSTTTTTGTHEELLLSSPTMNRQQRRRDVLLEPQNKDEKPTKPSSKTSGPHKDSRRPPRKGLVVNQSFTTSKTSSHLGSSSPSRSSSSMASSLTTENTKTFSPLPRQGQQAGRERTTSSTKGARTRNANDHQKRKSASGTTTTAAVARLDEVDGLRSGDLDDDEPTPHRHRHHRKHRHHHHTHHPRPDEQPQQKQQPSLSTVSSSLSSSNPIALRRHAAGSSRAALQQTPSHLAATTTTTSSSYSSLQHHRNVAAQRRESQRPGSIQASGGVTPAATSTSTSTNPHRSGFNHASSNATPASSTRTSPASTTNSAPVYSTLAGFPTYSSTSFVRAYISESNLSLQPAVIVSGLAALMNIVAFYFLQHHVLDTRDHLGLFLIGSYLVFSSYYMIYYFLERFSASFRRIHSQDKKFYIIGNLLKAGVLISITPFAVFHLTKIIVFDEWQGETLQNLGCIYAIPDFISMIVVKRMRWSTWIHHLCVVLFNYFSILNDYQNENVLRCVVVYASFSSFAYCVNVLLASRFLGMSPTAARFLSFGALLIYAGCCAVNWCWQAYYLHRLLSTGHRHWSVYVYMCMIVLVMYDDMILNKWLLRYAKNTAFAASQLQRQQQQRLAQQQQQAQQYHGQPLSTSRRPMHP